MDYQINTTKLISAQSDLEQVKNSISQKNTSFGAGAFHSTGNLSRALWKVGVTFKNIEKNLEHINLYLKEYVEDISNYENGGQVSVALASSALRENQSLMGSKSFSYEMNSSKLFSIKHNTPSQNSSFKNDFGPSSFKNDASSLGVEPSVGDVNEEKLPFFDLDMPDFNLDLFDFNFDELKDFNLSDFSLGDFLNSTSFDFSSFGQLSMATIGAMDLSALDFSTINWNSTFLKDLSPIGNLNLSFLEKVLVSDFDDSQKTILKDFLTIKGINVNSFEGLDLKALDWSKLDLSSVQFEHDLVNFVNHQLAIGKITNVDALNLLHQLFPKTANFDLKNIMSLYGINGDFSMSASLGSPKFSSVGVSSALVLGFGAIGGVGAGVLKNRSKITDSSASTSRSISTNKNMGHEHVNHEDLRNRSISDKTIQNDDKSIISSDKISHDVKLSQNSFLVDNLSGLSSFVDQDAIIKDVLVKLKKFNQVKTSSTYYQLVEEAWSMRHISSKSDEDFKLALQIPQVLPDIFQKRYLYWELTKQNIYPRNIDSYEHLKVVIHKKFDERFKWLDLEKIDRFESVSFFSYFPILDDMKCGNVKRAHDFESLLMVIDAKINEMVHEYQQTYLTIVPHYFYSDRVISEQSTSYDKVMEKLESLSVQAVLNSLSYYEGKDFLIDALLQFDVAEKNLYLFKEMVRIKLGIIDRILVVRVGYDIETYCYYAFYPQVGLKRIDQLDVNILMQNGFQLKEE